MGYKLKTKKAAAKRFPKVTAKGNVVRGQRNHGHFLSHRGQKAYNLAGTTLVANDDLGRLDKLLPYEGAKRKRTKALRNALAAARRAKAATTEATAK